MLPIIILLTITATLASVLPPSPSSSLVMTTTPAPLSSSSSSLTCSAAAAGLSPVIRWLRDGQLVSGEEKEGENRAEMTEVISVLEPGCSNQPQVFTCLALAGKETITSQTLVLPAEETEECHHQTIITTWYNNLLVLLGSKVELRCDEVVGGVTRSGVWLGQGAGADGRLVIKDVQWSDMGLYTCITQDQGPRTTFLYPLTME